MHQVATLRRGKKRHIKEKLALEISLRVISENSECGTESASYRILDEANSVVHIAVHFQLTESCARRSSGVAERRGSGSRAAEQIKISSEQSEK